MKSGQEVVVRAFVDAFKEEGGHVALAGVRQHGEDDRAFRRLLREYFPKHQDIAQYPDEYIEKAVLALNNRPRKCLQWRTPYEVYFNEVLHLV